MKDIRNYWISFIFIALFTFIISSLFIWKCLVILSFVQCRFFFHPSLFYLYEYIINLISKRLKHYDTENTAILLHALRSYLRFRLVSEPKKAAPWQPETAHLPLMTSRQTGNYAKNKQSLRANCRRFPAFPPSADTKSGVRGWERALSAMLSESVLALSRDESWWEGPSDWRRPRHNFDEDSHLDCCFDDVIQHGLMNYQ